MDISTINSQIFLWKIPHLMEISMKITMVIVYKP